MLFHCGAPPHAPCPILPFCVRNSRPDKPLLPHTASRDFRKLVNFSLRLQHFELLGPDGSPILPIKVLT